MDSSIILKKCYEMVLEKGFHLNNLDLTIYSQNVRIAPIREKIELSISSMLGVKKDQVSVKATTWEKMGFIGEGKALACECVCLVEN